MQKKVDVDRPSERRAHDRRVKDNPEYAGSDRRKKDRRVPTS